MLLLVQNILLKLGKNYIHEKLYILQADFLLAIYY